MRWTAAFGRLEQFHLEPGLDVGHAVQRPDPARPFFEKRTEPAGATPTEVSLRRFRLLRAQFLLLEGDKPEALGSRALETLIALVERHGELVGKQDLSARVRRNVSVEPADLTIHMSALRPRRVTAGMGIASSSTSPNAAAVSSPQSLCRLTMIECKWRSTGKFGEALLRSRRCLVSTNVWVERFSILSDPPIAQAFAEMALRPSVPHTVQSLSLAVGLSRSAFMARFSTTLEECLMSLLRRVRMRHTANLLTADALSVDQVNSDAN